ncbi:MAG TPA: hypothetical protein VFT10_01215, partial [Solirubrobacterales bacterium]|nr:hypothetical protein [Solirubrobacterales bacterium]
PPSTDVLSSLQQLDVGQRAAEVVEELTERYEVLALDQESFCIASPSTMRIFQTRRWVRLASVLDEIDGWQSHLSRPKRLDQG